jgi:hypothetical protein
MNTNALATAVAAKATSVTGVRGSSAAVPDTIPASPWVVVGPHSGTIEAGNMDRIRYTFPLRAYVQRTADDARTQTAINDLVDAMITGYRNGLTYGGTTADCHVTAWNTDLYAEVGEAFYQVVEFTMTALVIDTSGHTP